MHKIDILLQGEAIADVQLVTLSDGAGTAEILKEANKLRGGFEAEGEYFVFEQDSEEPLKPGARLPRPRPGTPLCLHIHRCRKVKVVTTFNGKTVEWLVSPARMIGAIKTHVAVKLFDMDREDAAEHVLQLTGTTERPDPDTHVGVLAHDCTVAFDLVPLVRVEG